MNLTIWISSIVVVTVLSLAGGCCKKMNGDRLLHEVLAQDLADAADRSAENDFARFVRLNEPPFFYATTEFNFFVPGVGYRPQVEKGGEILVLPVRPLFHESGRVDPAADDRALEYIKEFNSLMLKYVLESIM